MSAKDCCIVLSRPRDPKNIGAAARAMKNFGFTDLRIVGIHPPTWDEVTSAPHAEDVLRNARVYPTLAEAAADCNFVVGTVDPTRIENSRHIFTPVDLNRELNRFAYRAAIVFGSEKTGLTKDDLSHCREAMSIPTSAECPSMNLGQSVAVCCYELIRETAPPAFASAPVESANARVIDETLRLSLEILRGIDFVLPGNEPVLTRRLRAAFMRLNPTKYDIEMLCGILSRIKRELEK